MRKIKQVFTCGRKLWLWSLCNTLFIFSLSQAQQLITLKQVAIEIDTADVKQAEIVLIFNSTPYNFPVYAMTEPERIIIDCANTKLKKGLIPGKSPVPFIKNVAISGKIIDKIPNTRVEIFLKVNAFYKAYIYDKKIIISVTQTGTIKKSVSLFKAEEVKKDIPVIHSLDVSLMEEYCEINLAFSGLPKAASVYKMESPPRIVMDFYNIFINKAFEKEVAISPIKKVSVIKKDNELPYVGVIVHLERDVPFHYEQLNGRMTVTIPLKKEKSSKRRKIFLISTGVVLTGGVVTGILIRSDEAADSKDLGKPPDLPDQ